MTSLSLFDPNLPNFHNLALFICHLFVDGKFRSGHIIHDSSDINSKIPEFIAEVQSTCRDSIPWLSTDVAEDRFGDPSPSASPWQPDQNTDEILQLIFLDPQHFPTNINQLKDMVTYYHFFLFDSTDKVIFSELVKMDSSVVSSAFILYYNTKSDGVSVYKPSIPSEINFQASNLSIGIQHLFALYQNEWIVTIKYGIIIAACDKNKKIAENSKIFGGHAFMANFYATQLNAPYLNISLVACTNMTSNLVRHKSQTIYKELAIDDEPIDWKSLKMLNRNHSKVVQLNFYDYDAVMSGFANIIPLYPYHSTDVSVVYIHGINSKQEKYRIAMTKSGFSVFCLISAFLFLAAVVLCYVRKIFQLKRNEFIQCCMDVYIAFYAGGNVNVRHKIERWIIGILLMGAFFLNTFWFESVLFPSFLTYDSSVKTFDDLAKINPPIYTVPLLEDNEALIREDLRMKLGTKLQFLGTNHLEILKKTHKSSFVYIVPTSFVGYVEYIIGERNIDVLRESIDDLSARFYLTSNERVSDRIICKINRKTSLMMQSGLYRFYISFSRFWEEIREQSLFTHSDDSAEVQLTLSQLMEVMKLYVLLMAISCIIFLFEIMVDRFKRWKQRNNRVSEMEMVEVRVDVASKQPERPETCAGPSRILDSASSSSSADSAGPSNISRNVVVLADIHHAAESDSSD